MYHVKITQNETEINKFFDKFPLLVSYFKETFNFVFDDYTFKELDELSCDIEFHLNKNDSNNEDYFDNKDDDVFIIKIICILFEEEKPKPLIYLESSSYYIFEIFDFKKAIFIQEEFYNYINKIEELKPTANSFRIALMSNLYAMEEFYKVSEGQYFNEEIVNICGEDYIFGCNLGFKF